MATSAKGREGETSFASSAAPLSSGGFAANGSRFGERRKDVKVIKEYVIIEVFPWGHACLQAPSELQLARCNHRDTPENRCRRH